jgi:ABC-2 type transport system permease protein
LNTLARFWPLWVCYLLAWLLPLIGLPGTMRYVSDPEYYILYRLPNQIYYYAIVVSFIAAAFSAMAVFSHLYGIKSAGMTGALPLRREAVFLTQMLAGIVCFWAANVLVFLLAAGAEAGAGLLKAGLPYLGQLLAIVCLLNLIFGGLAVLCAQLTGHILALPAAFVMLSFAAIVIEAIVRRILDRLMFGLFGWGSALTFLSPPAQLIGRDFMPIYSEQLAADGSQQLLGSVFLGWTWLAAYAAASLLLLCLALALYRLRRMETAGDFIALKGLKPVFKYCFATGCALVLTYILWDALGNSGRFAGVDMLLRILLTLLIGAFLGYFIAEMLTRKSFRVFRPSWRGFAVLAVSLTALALACEMNVFGFETHLPEESRVARAVLSSSGWDAVLTSREGISDVTALQKGIVADKAEHEQAVTDGDDVVYVSIDYYGADGSVFMRRRYGIAAESADIGRLTAVMNSREAVNARKMTEIPVTEDSISYATVGYYDAADSDFRELRLTPTEAYDLYTSCIVPDIEDGSLGHVWILTDDSYYDTVCAVSIHIELMQREPDGDYSNDYFDTTLTVDAVRTAAWLGEQGIEPVLQRELYGEGGPYAEKYMSYDARSFHG